MNSICFHFASEFLILTLAQMFNSLVRVSRRVVCQIKQTWHTLLQYKVLEVHDARIVKVSPREYRELTKYGTRFHHSDFRYFNSPSGVLFNFPSRYLYAIGLFAIFSVG